MKVRCPGCQGVPKRWETKKAGPNQGKFFIKCAKPVNQQCLSFFEWEQYLHIIHPELVATVRYRYDPRGSDGDEMSYPRSPRSATDEPDYDHWREVPETNIPDRD